MSAGELFIGRVMHRRLRPRMHHLRYQIFSLLFDLDEINRLDRDLRFFSHQRFNLLSFHDCDHGDGSDVSLRDQAVALLKSAGIFRVGRIRLLAMPRVLGFMFNPLSVYFCDDPEGALAAILYEVHNTFGDRHTYILPVEDRGATVTQAVAKSFHVSPFLPMDLAYSFRVTPPGDALKVAICVADGNGPILTAVHSAKCRKLSDGSILRTVAAHPLIGLKVVAAILWEAARLMVKGVSVHPRAQSLAASTAVNIARPRDQAKAA